METENMETAEHIFIVNPAAGKGFPVTLAKRVNELLTAVKAEYPETGFKIIETKYPGHAAEIARDFSSRGIYRIYSVGGDGTLNEVINGMAGTESSLGCIPGGTGNDFIKTVVEDYRTPELLKETILGVSEKVDLGCINGRYFHNVLSVGFDSRVNREACRFKKRPFVTPKAAYYLGIASSLRSLGSERYKVITDGREEDKEVFMISVCNGKEYGGGYKIAPHADLKDGMLDVVTVGKIGLMKIAKYIPLLKKGEHLGVSEITSEKVKNLIIRSEEPILLNIDGEIAYEEEANITAVPEAINFIFPKSAEL